MNLNAKVDITQLTELFSNYSIEFTNSGRTSLYVILKSLRLPQDSNIGVPLYCCPSVFDAIIQAGHKPLFLDIDPENYTLSPEHLIEKIDEIKAIVVIHTFGRPADMDKIQEIAGKKPIIEDCAHALLSRYKGNLTGTITTAGFFSFRTGKYISAGEGGMIITRNTKLEANIKMEIQKLPKGSKIDEIKHVIKTYTRSVLYHRPWFGLLSLPLGSKLEDKIDLMNKYSFKTTRIRNTDLQTFVKKLNGFQDKVEIQRRNSKYLIEKLDDTGLKLPLETENTYCNYYLLPVQADSESERDRICEFLRTKGIDTTKLFSKTPAIAKVNYGYKGDCPITENIANRIMTIPNYYTLKEDETKKVLEAMRLCLSSTC